MQTGDKAPRLFLIGARQGPQLEQGGCRHDVHAHPLQQLQRVGRDMRDPLRRRLQAIAVGDEDDAIVFAGHLMKHGKYLRDLVALLVDRGLGGRDVHEEPALRLESHGNRSIRANGFGAEPEGSKELDDRRPELRADRPQQPAEPSHVFEFCRQPSNLNNPILISGRHLGEDPVRRIDCRCNQCVHLPTPS